MPSSADGGFKKEAPIATSAEENRSWSPWYHIDDEQAKDALPHRPGVYEVQTDFEISRLRGSSRAVTIGSANEPGIQEKINPMMGAAGVSAVPMAARVVQRMGQEENPQEFPHHACHGH